MRKNDSFAKGDEVYELVAASKLPLDVRKRICLILDEMGSSGARQFDVARELIAHFEDGLAAGKSTEYLLTTFGDKKTTARMIAQQKRRQVNPVRMSLGR